MPTGARVDYTVANDAVGGSGSINTSWNAFWDAAVTRTDEGWFAEIRIPFSSLRFQDEHGRVTMGLTATRWIARNTSTAVFPAIPPEWGFWSFIKPSQARKVVFEGVYGRKPLYVTPYALGGLGQDFRLNGARTAYQRIDDPAYNLGLDLKYGLTSNLTLDLTLNTDFAQVEADDQQVNLTRFSLFFPDNEASHRRSSPSAGRPRDVSTNASTPSQSGVHARLLPRQSPGNSPASSGKP